MPGYVLNQEFEQRMLDCFKRGNEESFGEFYDCYAPLLFGFISRSIRNEATAECVFQAVLMDIWQTKLQYNKESERLSGWVMKKVRTHVARALQNESSSIQISAANVSLSSPSQTNVTDPSTAALELIYVNRLTLAEAAAALNLPSSTLLPMIRQSLRRYKPRGS